MCKCRVVNALAFVSVRKFPFLKVIPYLLAVTAAAAPALIAVRAYDDQSTGKDSCRGCSGRRHWQCTCERAYEGTTAHLRGSQNTRDETGGDTSVKECGSKGARRDDAKGERKEHHGCGEANRR